MRKKTVPILPKRAHAWADHRAGRLLCRCAQDVGRCGAGDARRTRFQVLVLAAALILGLYFIPERLTVGFVGVGHLIRLGFPGRAGTGRIFLYQRLESAGRHERSDAGDGGGQRYVRGHGGQLRHHGAGHAWGGQPSGKAGQKVGINGTAVSGMLFSFISLFPAFYMMKDMNPRGKVACRAFSWEAPVRWAAICPMRQRKSRISLSPCLSGK